MWLRSSPRNLLGRNWDVFLALDDASGFPLYLEIIKIETTADCLTAVSSIDTRSYFIEGVLSSLKCRPIETYRDKAPSNELVI